MVQSSSFNFLKYPSHVSKRKVALLYDGRRIGMDDSLSLMTQAFMISLLIAKKCTWGETGDNASQSAQPASGTPLSSLTSASYANNVRSLQPRNLLPPRIQHGFSPCLFNVCDAQTRYEFLPARLIASHHPSRGRPRRGRT